MFSLLAAFGVDTAAAQTIFAKGLPPCKNTFPTPGAQTPSQVASLDLLGSLTQLESARGKPVLDSNFRVTVAINNQASPAARAQALKDALITDFNAFTLADGLGAKMAKIYQDKAIFESDNGGLTTRCGEIGPAVSNLIAAANALSGGDSNAGKFGFADGVAGRYKLPPGGVYDVLGQAYGYPAAREGADKFGNSRPFQTAPLDATQGPHIETYGGREFFGAQVNARIMLEGSPNPAVVGSDLRENPSYPSGHTTFGYSEALILAMMVPERLRALAYRGSEYGDSRIVIGAHYPVDVIAGRTLATYDLAQDLAGRPDYATVDGRAFQASLAEAAGELRDYLKAHGCPSIAACAHEPIVRAADATILNDGHLKPADPRQSYAFRLDYGLAPMGPTDLPPAPVPVAAGFLLQSRFPYLTAAQRGEVLRTTEGPSGHFLDVDPRDGKPLAETAHGPAAEAGVYARLDLFAAAGGYGAFVDQVTVDQEPVTDPNLEPFADLARADTWSNDISGPGGLTKRGAGSLTLSGTCTYAGPTIVGGGTLEVAGSVTSSTKIQEGGTLVGAGRVGDVAVEAQGTLAPGASGGDGALEIDGALALAERATVVVRDASADPKIRIAGKATLNDATLMLRRSASLRPGATFTLLTAKGGISGTFAHVRTDTPDLVANLTYSANAVYLTLDAAAER